MYTLEYVSSIKIDFNASQYLVPWNTMYFQQNKNKVIETITWLLTCIR